MSRSEALRGPQWLAKGEAVVADRIDRKRSPANDGTDWSTHEGALKLARRIEEHWGGRIRVEVVSVSGGAAGRLWAVRSTLGPVGLPG